MKVSIIKTISIEIDKLLFDLKFNKGFDEKERETIIDYLFTALQNFDGLSDDEIKLCITLYLAINFDVIYVKKKCIIIDDTLIRHPEQLMCHMYDCICDIINNEPYALRKTIVKQLMKLPATVQGSVEWLAERKDCLTATAISTALDENPYEFPLSLLIDKSTSKIKFEPTVMTHHGNKYENIINMVYSYRNNVIVAEFGMIRHKKIKIVGASPDGICTSKTLDGKGTTKLVGRLVEIKCPYSRVIKSTGNLDGEIVPHYYYVQVQVQLSVCDLDECTFIQCKIEEYASWEDYVKDSDPFLDSLSKSKGKERGCIIRLQPKDGSGPLFSKYLYPEKLHMTIPEIKEWIAEQTIAFPNNSLSEKYYWDRPLFWKVMQYQENLIQREKNWIEDRLSQLEKFWAYVEFYRAYPEKMEKIIAKLDKDAPIEQTGFNKGKRKISFELNAKYFKMIHDECSKENKKKYSLLYQKPTEERLKIMEKYKK